MNILVTGARGFLGSQLCKYTKDHKIIGLYRDSLCGGYIAPEVWGDVCDYPRMLEIIVNQEIDQIYHCAARSIVRNCINDPLGCFYTNVIGTATILEAARQSGRIQGVMCMESDKAYGPGPVPYSEDQRLQPQGIYEASKACVSHLVSSYWHNYGLPVFGVRSANVYGPGDPNLTRLIPHTITRLKEGKKPQITAEAMEYEREFLYVDDYVRRVTLLMEVSPWGESINVGTGASHRVGNVVAEICKQMDKPNEVEVWDKPTTLKEIPIQRLDTTKIQGYLPVDRSLTALRLGLKETIEWYS